MTDTDTTCGATARGNSTTFECALPPHPGNPEHQDHFHGRQTHPPFGPETFVTYFLVDPVTGAARTPKGR